MQAQLALWTGKHLAKVSGDYHEWQGKKLNHQDKKEEMMDKWNNAQGREIAKEIIEEYGLKSTIPFNKKINDILAEKIIKRMNEGKLILSPDGRRKPKKELRLNQSKQNFIVPKGCAGTYPVSGYIRNDGIKVSAYTRTCGAKHTGKEKYANKRMQDLSPKELLEAISYFV